MSTRKAMMVPAAITVAALLAACGGGDSTSGGSDSGGEGGGDVELTFWHNSTTGPGAEYWDETAAMFEEETGIKVNIQAVQNEDMDGKLQTALNSGDAPDVFMARGGGKLADIVEAGQALDLTDLIDDDVRDAVGGTLNAFTVDGKVYGMPTSVLPGGIYYNKAMFEEAGIEGTPTTVAELEDAVAKLKGIGVDPIALGGKAAWPAAHWYYFFALRTCSQEAMEADAAAVQFEDPCWEQAAQELQDFASVEPFNPGFLTTDAQGSAASSAGMIANEQAAMELMGAWNPGVIADLTPDKQPMEDLGWFPFPEVEGGEGDPTAMMGGVDGYACWAQAPAEECAAFLNFYMSQERQEAYAEAFVTLPASQEAQGVVTDPALVDILEAYNEAAYVQVWLDTAFGQNVGNALNAGVVEMLAGNGTPEGIVSAVNDAAARG
ncbi:extracellular solute-binding protein [Actinotalea sp. Marseille-Q4924]|uniref:extracellular solute-binding protein n=1 Tax=Actinotalea sp. Marseille-Q4924 TaxID=2866571 RepID=UPI001CE41EB4|nr:extracellular solute-binding protein [Actinotalea sp. Marseille-Q4924]